MPAADFGGPNSRPDLKAANFLGTRTVPAAKSTSQRGQFAPPEAGERSDGDQRHVPGRHLLGEREDLDDGGDRALRSVVPVVTRDPTRVLLQDFVLPHGGVEDRPEQ
nr:hypothetical protein Ade03nite_62160 [Actinoplanes derwentensis]